MQNQQSATHYNQFYKLSDFKRNYRKEAAFIRALIAKYGIKPGAHLLDVGCGTGFYCHLFATFGMTVTGVDLSETAVKKAKEAYETEATWIVSNALELPFKNEFDVLFVSGFS